MIKIQFKRNRYPRWKKKLTEALFYLTDAFAPIYSFLFFMHSVWETISFFEDRDVKKYGEYMHKRKN